MTQEELIQRYPAMSDQAKITFIARVAYNLTIMLRGDYDSHDLPLRLKRLTGSNELQHHLSSQIGHHSREDARRYPDDVFMNILMEKATHYDLGGELKWSITEAMQ